MTLAFVSLPNKDVPDGEVTFTPGAPWLKFREHQSRTVSQIIDLCRRDSTFVTVCADSAGFLQAVPVTTWRLRCDQVVRLCQLSCRRLAAVSADSSRCCRAHVLGLGGGGGGASERGVLERSSPFTIRFPDIVRAKLSDL